MRLTENPYILEDLEAVASSSMIDWEKFRSKTIAVTGATGLLGKLMVLALLKADEKYQLDLRVLAFLRDRKKAECIFDGARKEHLTYVVQDIAERPADEYVADFLIHTAAITTSKLMVEKPVETILTAIEGTKAMLEYAARCRMQSVVFLSSMEAYGTIPEGAGQIREKDLGFIDPMEVRSSYSEGKRMCECLSAAFASEYAVPVKVARLSATSGPGIDPEDKRVIGQFARSVIYGKDIVLHTKGDKANCYLYTADALTGILFLLLNGESGEVYNICNPQTFSSALTGMSSDVIASTYLTEGDIYLSNNTLYISRGKSFLKGYRSYLHKDPGVAGAKTVGFGYFNAWDDEEDITHISVAELADEARQSLGISPQAGVYNMAGQKVSDTVEGLPSGIYITNGKKLVVE